MAKDRVVLKKGKEKAVLNRHHWIFSGAIQSMPNCDPGTILPVHSSTGTLLGQAYCNRKTSIAGRMISFGDEGAAEAVRRNILGAIKLRKMFFGDDTTAYRLINGEGDHLPGLIADRYGSLIVIQIATAGMERLKKEIVSILIGELSPDCIYEKSTIPARAEEGLAEFADVLHGEVLDPVEILESGIRFLVPVAESQKTGFYLDQREMRVLLRSQAHQRKVLNCFAYTGAGTVYALKGGASRVDSVDTSEEAMILARENVQRNGFDIVKNKFYVADVFQFLRGEQEGYDIIVLDPPAFARKRKDVVKACRGYKDINRLAIRNVSRGGLVFTSSCSYYVDEALFQQVAFQAAREADRAVRIVQKHHQAFDHPVNICHPESAYLKSLVLYVE